MASRTRRNRFRSLRARPPTKGPTRCASIASSAETARNGEGSSCRRLEECKTQELRPEPPEHREPWQWRSMVSRNAWRVLAALAYEETATSREQSWEGLGSALPLGKRHAQRTVSPVPRRHQRAVRCPSRFGRGGSGLH